jgi:hypothetical protein
MATISERLREIANDDDLGPGTTEVREALRDGAEAHDAAITAMERAERHIVNLYRGMSPHANYNDHAIGNRFADSDDEVKALRAALALARGEK